MALIDAVASDVGVPLWRLFGGVSNTITTDITVEFFYDLYKGSSLVMLIFL